MNSLVLGFGLLLGSCGWACLYLTSPHQRWRASPLPAKPARWVALPLSLSSVYAFTRTLDLVPAVFTFVSWTMVLLVAFPYLGAAIAAARRGR
jgi:hypothetical protein